MNKNTKSSPAPDGTIGASSDAPEQMYFSPEQIQQFFQIAPVAVAVFDKNLNYMAASRKYKKDYDIGAADVIGRNHFDLFPHTPNEVKAQYQSCLNGASFEDEVTAFKSPTGETEWLKWTMQPWYVNKDTIGGVVLFTEFISDQQKKEAELEENKTFLQAVLESVQDGIMACDADGNISVLNAASQKILGAKELRISDNVEGQGYNLYKADGITPIPLKDRPMVRALRGEIVDEDEIVLRQSGRPTYRILAHGRPMMDADGEKLGAVVSIHDITEEARVTQELRDREERYRDLYNKTPVMLHSVDNDGFLVRVSDFWLEKLGYEREEVIGKRFYDLLPAASRDYVRDEVLPAFLRDGFVDNTEFKIEKKSGELIDVQLTAVAEYDDGGALKNSLTVLTDVTERKEAEAQLLQAQKLEAVGQLTGGLAHDFNNLLGVILLSLQLLERMHESDEKSLSRIRQGLDATLKGAELTRRLLAFSRKQTLETSVINVNELIEEMRGLFVRTLGGTIEVETHYDDGIWPVEIDRHQLESCLLNLAINARDAMPGGGQLVIDTSNVSFTQSYFGALSEVKAGRYVLVSVTDTGMGIPPDILDQVFQPFFTTKESGQGTGLGLSMVYGFVNQSNGQIDIRSTEYEGTSIDLYLPAVDAVHQETSGGNVTTSEEIIGGNETILLVDDDEEVRSSTRLMLESLGYNVIDTADGINAVNILRSASPIDLVFSDIVMPGGIDGFALADKSREIRPGVKVLLTTGYAEVAFDQERQPKEETEIINKPYLIEDVAGHLRALLD